MAALTDILVLLAQTFGQLLVIAFVLRLLLQIARADFYNPISQFIVKVTNPALIPARRMVPSIGGIDTASIVVAIILQALAICAIYLLKAGALPPLGGMAAWSVLGVAAITAKLYLYAVIANIILSWVAAGSNHPGAALVNQLVEPIMAPCRKIIPPMGGLDLSPIFVILGYQVIEVLLRHGAVISGMPRGVVFGL